MRTRWITFDCFGTLVDWHTGFANLLRPLVGARTPEIVAAYHRFERQLEAERPHRPYKDVLATGLLAAARDIGIPLSETEARRLPNSWAALPVFPDVEDMLAGLRALGCRLGVLTNCDLDLFAQTQRNFRHPFDLVVTAEEVRSYKPALAHFHQFARTTNVDLADWVHVACSYFHDIEPARRFGVQSIWLDRDRTGENPSAATAHVRTATEVCPVVTRLWP